MHNSFELRELNFRYEFTVEDNETFRNLPECLMIFCCGWQNKHW